MPLGPARAVLQARKGVGGGAPSYASFGTIVYEARDAAGLTIPFDPASITTMATGSIAAVFKVPTVASQAYYICGSGATAAADPGVAMITLNTGSLRGKTADGTTQVQPSIGSGTIQDNTPIVGLIKWQNGGSVFVRVGAAETSLSIAALGSLGTDQMRVGNTFGALATAGLQNGGTLYHIIIFSTFVTTLSSLQTALNTDWGL
jgi:hypothetical protein